MITCIVGMSHVGSLARALKARPRPAVTVINVRQEKIDLFRDLPARQALVARVGVVDVVGLALEGNLHNVFALLNDPQPFWMVGTPENGQFIPQEMMLAHMAERLQKTLLLGQVITGLFPNARRILIIPPPPAGDAEHIRRYPVIFADKIGLGVSPDALRLRMYDLQTEVFAAHARSLNAVFLPSPAAARDDTGKLAPCYWSTDPTHGNADYGQLVLDAIEATMKEPA